MRGCQFVRKVCGEKGLKEVTRGFVTPEKEDMSTADWEEFVKNGVEPVYHPVCTLSLSISYLLPY